MPAWLDQRFDQLSNRQNERQIILRDRYAVFGRLSRQIIRIVDACNEQGLQLRYSHNATRIDLAFPSPTSSEPDQSRKLNVTLNDPTSTIQGVWPSDVGLSKIEFGFQVEQNTAGLTFSGQSISAEDAAQKIMDPFLFGPGSPYQIA